MKTCESADWDRFVESMRVKAIIKTDLKTGLTFAMFCLRPEDFDAMESQIAIAIRYHHGTVDETGVARSILAHFGITKSVCTQSSIPPPK